MTSRERVRAALRRQPVDRIPIDFGGTRCTGISAIAYDRSLKYLGRKEDIYVYDTMQLLADPSVEMVNRMGGDFLQIHWRCPAWGVPIDKYKPSELPDGTPCLVPEKFAPVENEKGDSEVVLGGKVYGRRTKGGLYYDVVAKPYEHVETIEDVDALHFGLFSDTDIDFMVENAKRLYETTDKALILEFGGNFFENSQINFGPEKFFTDLILEKEMLHHFFDRMCDMYIAELKRIMPRLHQYVEVIRMGEDLGTQVSSQISREMYVEMIKPYHKRLYSFIHEEYPDVKIFLHSCGAIYDLIPELIDAGVDILNPVQISARGMDPQKLKDEFGDKLIFWGGGADMQQTVPKGSVEDIKKEVKSLVDIFAKDGGFVFNQVHNIQADVPPEKVLAIFDTAQEAGRR